MTGATSNLGFPLGYIARSRGAAPRCGKLRPGRGDKQACLQSQVDDDDDTPTNACPHPNLIRVDIDADKVPAAVKSRVHHHMLWVNGLQSYAPESYTLRFLSCTSGVICTFNSTLRDRRSSGGEEEARFVSVRTITLSRYACVGTPVGTHPWQAQGAALRELQYSL